jgi:hypothetical protein
MKAPVWIQLRGIGDRGLIAQMAWNNIDDYRAMANVQLRRISDNNLYDALAKEVGTQVWVKLDVSPEERAGVEHMQTARATADAHFYLNCWRIVALNVFRIAKAVGVEELEQFLVDQQCPTSRRGDGLFFGDATESFTLGWYAQGRDHFEHIDERIFGGRHWEKLQTDPARIEDLTGCPRPEDAAYYPGPFFNGTHMIVGNSKWEITLRAHEQLLKAVQKVEELGDTLLAQQGDERSSSGE